MIKSRFLRKVSGRILCCDTIVILMKGPQRTKGNGTVVSSSKDVQELIAQIKGQIKRALKTSPSDLTDKESIILYLIKFYAEDNDAKATMRRIRRRINPLDQNDFADTFINYLNQHQISKQVGAQFTRKDINRITVEKLPEPERPHIELEGYLGNNPNKEYVPPSREVTACWHQPRLDCQEIIRDLDQKNFMDLEPFIGQSFIISTSNIIGQSDFKLARLKKVDANILQFEYTEEYSREDFRKETYRLYKENITAKNPTILYPIHPDATYPDLVNKILAGYKVAEFDSRKDVEYIDGRLEGYPLTPGHSYKVLCIRNGTKSEVGKWWNNGAELIAEANPYRDNAFHFQNTSPLGARGRHFIFIDTTEHLAELKQRITNFSPPEPRKYYVRLNPSSLTEFRLPDYIGYTFDVKNYENGISFTGTLAAADNKSAIFLDEANQPREVTQFNGTYVSLVGKRINTANDVFSRLKRSEYDPQKDSMICGGKIVSEQNPEANARYDVILVNDYHTGKTDEVLGTDLIFTELVMIPASRPPKYTLWLVDPWKNQNVRIEYAHNKDIVLIKKS